MSTRILVVEDSRTQAMALCAVLEENGFAVTHVASGEEALEQLADREVDLVLSDIVMPGISGYDLCRIIKADDRLAELPVVLLTSLSNPMDIVRGLESGADNYVTKPYDAEYLCSRIRHVLDRQRLRRAPRASLGVNVNFLGTTFSITSEKEQILDLFISSVEEVVRSNAALQESQRELAEAQQRLEEHARQLAREASASKEKYSLLMHEANDAILVLDLEGTIIEANVRARELLASTELELRGKPLTQFATAESAPELRRQFATLKTRNRVEASELELAGNGKPVYCDFSASRTTSQDGDLVLAILHDVTELRHAFERLRRNESLLAEAERLAQLGSFERDLRSGTARWSTSTWALLGLDPARHDPTQELLFSLVHPDDVDALKDTLAAALRDGRGFTSDFRVVKPDGDVRFMHVRAVIQPDPQGRPSVLRGTLQDVTERRELEQQLLHAQKMEAVGLLAGGVAHDFNNLLTVITSYSGLLLADLPPADPHRQDVEEIQEAARRAAALTRQLLAFSRRQVLQPRVVDLNDLTTQLEKMLRRLIREDIDMVTDLDSGMGTVWADPGQLEQVLVNLVVNARDAMPDGGDITIRTRSVPDAQPGRAGSRAMCVMLEVADTGTGMPPEVQARIFEPFFTTKDPGKGTGLGLSTVYGIVSQSGGEIEVVSHVNQGTTFRILLPCHTGGSAMTTAAVPELAPQPAGGETVLLVEDDDALRTVAQRILEGAGYSVLKARNGVEALEQFSAPAADVDLVVTDMVMPGMSGFELAAAIRQRHPLTRMLFMSGYTRETVDRDGLTREDVSYLEKPFSASELITRVREALDNRSPAERASRAGE